MLKKSLKHRRAVSRAGCPRSDSDETLSSAGNIGDWRSGMSERASAIASMYAIWGGTPSGCGNIGSQLFIRT